MNSRLDLDDEDEVHVHEDEEYVRPKKTRKARKRQGGILDL